MSRATLPTRKQRGNDPKENQKSADLSADLAPLLSLPFVKGARVEVTLTASGNTTLKHGLGRTPDGWIPLGWQSEVCSFYELSRSSTELVFYSDYATVLDLWIF